MTHEEIVAELASTDIRSYRDVGVVVYQIQTKFRDELRPRGGLLRTREFIMKDAYSLNADEAGLAEAYRGQAQAYERIFRRLGLRDVHQIRSDTGVMGGSVAHEFMCLLDVGEDTVVFCRTCGDAWNTDVTGGVACNSCGNEGEARRGVEVGNIFQLGTRYTDALGAQATGRDGIARSVVMGSYGIGISRLLATLVEQGHDDRGIALTAATAAFGAHLVVLGRASGIEAMAADIYSRCITAGVDVLWDDRGLAAGQQLADADLIGAAVRVTVGRSTLDRHQVELRERRSGREHVVAPSDVPTAVRSLLDDLIRQEEIASFLTSWV
jgi:prolyl-tRNA synthetase